MIFRKLKQTLLSKIILFALFVMAFELHAKPMVKADGSSSVFPVTEAVAEEFQKNSKGKIHVTVGISGTGGGFKKFCRGETDVQNASRPISKSEMQACREKQVAYYELPIAFEGMAIVVNPKNSLNEIHVNDLKKMWAPEAQGKIMKWNQVNSAWPDQPLKLYGAGADSGTFDYFTEAIVGKAKSSRGDFTASEDDNVLIQGVLNDVNALAFVPYAYYISNADKLKVLAVNGGDKAPKKNTAVLPSNEAVQDGSYYPLSRPLFVYISESAYRRPEVKQFSEFYLKHASELVTQVKYVALPQHAYEMGLDIFSKARTGSVFGGENEVGIKIEELLKREAKL